MSFGACQALAFFTACGGALTSSAIEVVDDPATLTSGANDKLFTLTLSKGSESFYLLSPSVMQSRMVWAVTKTDQSNSAAEPFAIDCTYQDTNKNGSLVDVGDTFVCAESGSNTWDTDDVGRPVTLKLRANKRQLIDDGKAHETEVAEAVWTPN
jgi:hypothetical protein